MTPATEVFRRVRWSDGRIVSYRQDHVALGLHLWSLTSGITVTILWIASSRWAAWWVLIPLSIANGVGFELVARNRLRRAVLQAEALSDAEQAPVDVGLEDWFNFKLNRFYDYGIRLCDRKAEEFQALGETALANGKRWTAARYLRRAARERKYSEWSRRITERNPHPF